MEQFLDALGIAVIVVVTVLGLVGLAMALGWTGD